MELDCEFDCFREVEQNLKIFVPDFLKNVLKINGCNNAAVLRNLSEEDLEEIEKFMVSETALELIPNNELEQYYGVFHVNPRKFKLLLGHRKLLFLISKFFNDKYQRENSESEAKEKTLSRLGRSVPSTSYDVVSEGASEESRLLTSNLAPNLTRECTQVSQTVKNWIKSKCTNDEQWHYFKEKFSQISFEIKLNSRGELCCIMTCYCMSKYQMLKSSQKVNYCERWVYGNLHRHLSKHFNLYLQPKHITSEELVAKNCTKSEGALKKQQGIMKFITVSMPSNTTQSNLVLHCSEENRIGISKSDTLTHSITQNDCEFSNCIAKKGNLSPKNVNEAVAHDHSGPPKINILSNQVIASAIVHYPAEENSTLTVNQEMTRSLICNEKRKWTSEKYQRNMRVRRKREDEVINQSVITSFFPLLSTVETEVESIVDKIADANTTEPVGVKLNATIEALPQFNGKSSASHRSQLLKMLIDISIKNASSSNTRYHYNDVVKKFSLYLLYIGGRLLYETLQENMKGVLPSISTLNNFVTKTVGKTEEGIFDYDGLCTYLEDRNLPKVLWISEDGTRVTGKIEYDSKSNKLVGFTLPLVDGLPQTDAFLATSAKAIQDAFLTSSKSNYAYLVMAQPLSKSAAPYCLVVFGTDNKFNSDDVAKRWKSIKENLEKRGIILLGFSSDGDTRLLKSMRQHASLPPQSNDKSYKWEWYQAGYKRNDFSDMCYVQDTVHIATKLRTRLLNPKVTLTIGSFIAKPEHLEQLISNFSKEKHSLTASDLKREDKMCFKSAEKMFSEPVIQLLENIPESEGTRAYLRLMQFATASYLDSDLDINERLYKIWFCVFFLRIWRKWIADNSALKIADNFITSNCYLCIELNAHALINLCINFRENPNLTNDMFLPHLFSSQTCEKTFRATRSMTTTYSTVINYSIKDIVRRLDRISTINNILNDLRDVLIFPREEKRTRASGITLDLKNLSDEIIQSTVEKALQNALQTSESLGMQVPENSWNYIAIAASAPLAEDEKENDISYEVAAAEGDGCEIFNMLPPEQRQENENSDMTDPLADTQSEVRTDMYNLRVAGIGQELLLKDFSLKLTPEERDTVYEKGPLVRVTVPGRKSTVIKKSSLCWLLDETTQRVSTDRLRRFFTSKSKSSSQNSQKLKTKISPKSKSIAKKKQYTTTRKRNTRQIMASNSESSGDDEISVQYDDSTDTENFSNETADTDDYENSPDHTSTEISSSTTKTSTFTQNLEDSRQPECGKFYAIYCEQRWYLGLITEIVDDEYIVKFLRKKRKSEREFLWPTPDDISKVSKEFIFYGPIETEKKSQEVPLKLSNEQLNKINAVYKAIKQK